jgi:epoxyqueuosine reductase
LSITSSNRSVLTNAPLATVDRPPAQRCGKCELCVNICPVKAIKGKNYVDGEPRDVRLVFLKCHEYFESLKRTQPYPVCGMCLYVCPFGKQGK